VVDGRQGAALPRSLRPAGRRAARAADGLARRHRRRRGAAATPGRTRLQAAQALDVTDWLPNDLLVKLDRCLMAHGVEGRVPLLDTGVAAAAVPLPTR
jgi:asparagine synthetase B (glutamine-hydrolysing)